VDSADGRGVAILARRVSLTLDLLAAAGDLSVAMGYDAHPASK
jgi:hypothetical protein